MKIVSSHMLNGSLVKNSNTDKGRELRRLKVDGDTVTGTEPS